MPSFQSLPAEVLLMVAQILGSTYLRARTDRVLLCKAWYSITQSVAWEVVDLSIANFEKFLHAPITIHSFIRSRVKELSISGPYDDITSSPCQNGETDAEETWRVAKLRNLLQARNKTLCTSLACFSTNTLPNLHRIHSFSLGITSRSNIYTEVDNTWTSTIRNLITSLPRTITSLTIDKLGPISRFSTGARTPHAACKVVLLKDALPSLKHLRLRIHCICPSLFAIKTCGTNSNLETLVIGLDSYSSQLNIVHHAYRCTQPQQPSQVLYDDMVEAGKKALEAGCFPGMKTARILKYDVQSLALYSFDMVNGRNIEVPDGVGWDDIDWDRSRVEYDLVLRSGGSNTVLVSGEQSEDQELVSYT
ncbi:hypothetical protein VTL71DRAFT_7938 [Oculimacula yallundae]|uniref:F-box domain-containing protein n=1 Tax=Oculimacula yallundae TaxID=86028 RepID=A0ABR4CW96_9HELO